MYYCFTHMNALARDWDAKNGGDAYRFSPKFTYNMVNGGTDSGSWPTDGWSIATKQGAATWTDWPYDSDFKGWPLTATVWRNALNVRVNTTGNVAHCDTPTGMDQLKTLLVNGYVLSFATFVNSWQFKNITNDLSTTEDDAFVGKGACYYVNGGNGAHAMTVVGYNDAIWIDINGNGAVDAGEKGALRIANSWGTGWKDAGFTWLAYDALKSVSGVSGGPTAGRTMAWWSANAMYVTAKSAVTPSALAQFTLSHARRSDLRISLGMSDTSHTSPTTLWAPNYVLQNAGGAYAFNGSATAVDGIFVMDFSDIAVDYGTQKRWYLRVQDTATGSAATLKTFKWINVADNAEVVKTGLPSSLDNTYSDYYVDATMTHGASNTAPTITPLADQSVNEDFPTGTLAVTVGDAQTPAGNLTLSGTSSNITLVPNSNVVIGGSGANRTVVITPAPNQNGATTITLSVADAGGLITQTAFQLTVNPVNDAPVAQAQSLGVLLNTSKSILLSGSDVDGDALTYTPTLPAHGTLTGSAPALTYTPNNGYLGPDSFTFTANDGNLTSGVATVSILVDSTAPVVAITAPTNGATVSYTVAITANASDSGGVDRVVFFIDGVARSTDTDAPYAYNWDSTSVSNGARTITARAYDSAGNNTLSTAVNVTVNNIAPAQLVATPPSFSFYAVQGGPLPPVSPLAISNAVGGPALAWTVAPSTGWISASPISGGGDDTISVGIDTTALSLGLHAGTVKVTATGTNNPITQVSINVPITLTIAPATDTIPPTTPDGLAAAATGPTSAILSWAASTDAGGSGLAGYKLYRDDALIAQPAVAHFTDTGLTAGTSYGYAVSAIDNAGNQSSISANVILTVPSEGTPAGLVESYSFPDPARNGVPPVIRAVLGDVDNVEIAIYDMAGHPVHSARLDAPNAIVDGKSAYDYAWTGDIPSGIYYAVIHGKSGNKTIKARTRLTVSR